MSDWAGTLPTDLVPGVAPPGTDFTTILAAIGGLTDAWSSYTPTWTAAGTAVALGNGVLTGKYLRSGKFVAVRIVLVPGTTTTFGTSAYRFALPYVPKADSLLAALVHDTSASQRWGGVAHIFTNLASGDNMRIIVTDASGGLTGTAPFTMATSDRIVLEGIFETDT